MKINMTMQTVAIDKAKEVLKPFFKEPSKPRYIREANKQTDLSYERTYHYLKKLKETGALKSEKRGRNREYKLNKRNDLIKKIFSILEMEKRQEFFQENPEIEIPILKVKEKLLNETEDQIKFLILFGSTARGQATEKSDVDILAVTATDTERIQEKIKKVEEDQNTTSPLNFSIQTTGIEEFRRKWRKEPAYTSIWHDKILLFGEELFWREILKLGEPI